MNISDFVSQMNLGMARTNRFSVLMAVPAGYQSSSPNPPLKSFQQLLMFCDQVQLPGITVNTAPVRIFGEVRETPTEFNYEPLQMSFYVDNSMEVKQYFDDWAKLIQNGESRTQRYYDEYICPQMQILVQDTLDNNRMMVELYECYPKSVGAVQLDWANKDIMKLSVTMQYKYWREMTLVPNNGSLDSAIVPGVVGNGGGQFNTPNVPGVVGSAVGQPLSAIAGDINQIKSIPQQYLSQFNAFQSNLIQNITSGPNQILGALTGQSSFGRIPSTQQNVTSDLPDPSNWSF